MEVRNGETSSKPPVTLLARLVRKFCLPPKNIHMCDFASSFKVKEKGTEANVLHEVLQLLNSFRCQIRVLKFFRGFLSFLLPKVFTAVRVPAYPLCSSEGRPKVSNYVRIKGLQIPRIKPPLAQLRVVHCGYWLMVLDRYSATRPSSFHLQLYPRLLPECAGIRPKSL